MIVTDQNPEDVTILIKDNSEQGGQEAFTLSRSQMIEALEYILAQIKASNGE